MRNLNPSLLLLLSFLLLVSHSTGDKLVIVMIDGFRWDYASRMSSEDLPNLKRLISEGTEAEYVQPIFPSVSFPCWTSIVTGLYAESHGIVGNYIYDEETDTEFSLSKVGLPDDNTANPFWWRKHVPLWISSTEQGIRTSLYEWSRCDVPFRDANILPEKCLPYDNVNVYNITWFEEMIDDGIEDLEDGFDLVLLYFCGVDEVGHLFGPEHERLGEEMREVDRAFGRLMDGLEGAGLAEETNIVVVSDHGMTDVRDNPSEALSRFTDPANLHRVVDRGAFTYISLIDKSLVDQVVQDLQTWEGVNVFKREDIPEHLHIGGDEHLLDILVVTKGEDLVGWDGLANANDYLPFGAPSVSRGMHGWDDTSPDGSVYVQGDTPDMRGIFFARGPAFRQGYKHQWIKQVDEYQIFLHVLGIEGEPHNGTWERVQGMFSEVEFNGAGAARTYSLLLIVALAVLALKATH